MKKVIYYALPFVVFPLFIVFFELLDQADVEPHAVVVFVIFPLLSALLGALSPTDRAFDLGITLAFPTAAFLSLFVALYFDKDCGGQPRLSLSHALNWEYYLAWLPVVLACAASALIFSLQPIRRRIRGKR